MTNQIEYICDSDSSNLINKLIRFLGRQEVERSLKQYKASLQSAGLIFGEYYLKHRHPWWNAFIEFFEIEKSGKSIEKNLTTGIKELVSDAKKITTLQKLMPEAIKAKYKKDLIDDERARDYLFELQIAWHFFLKNYSIKWHENTECHSEFLINTPIIDFNVECKRISVDASRMIRRRDFYRFAEKIIPDIDNEGYFGVVDIIIEDRLSGNENYLNELAKQVLNEFSKGQHEGDYKIPYGSFHLDLKPKTGLPVDLKKYIINMRGKKSPQAHGVVFANEKFGKPIDPIELTLKSSKSNKVLDGIKKKISKAAKVQLETSKPGLLICSLEGIEDFAEIGSDSGLQIMSSLLLLKESFAHIAAISYMAGSRSVEKAGNEEKTHNRGLIYWNPKCKFEKARNFPFLSETEKEFQYRLSDVLTSHAIR